MKFILSEITNNATALVHELDFNQLKSFILTNSWSCGTYKNGHRNIKNFISASIIGLDFDNGLSLDDAIAQFKDYKCIISTTKSHQQEKNNIKCDRFRVILFPDKVYNKTQHDLLFQTLQNEYPIDKATKDCSRYYYPSSEIVYFNETGNLIEIQDVTESPENTVQNTEKKVERNFREVAPRYGRLSQTTQDFLTQGKILPEGRSHTFYKVCIDAREQGYDKNWCYTKLVPVLEQINYFDDYNIDKVDATLNQVYNKDLRHPPRQRQQTAAPQQQRLEEELETVATALNEKYVVLSDDEGNRRILLKREDNQVSPISIDHAVSTAISELALAGITKTERQTKEYVKTWIARKSPLAEEPTTVSFKGTKDITYHRLTFDPVDGPTPCFDAILSNIENSEAMCAYFWSLLEPESYKQQVLWWTGLGGDGKGSMSMVLEWLFGRAFLGTSSDDYMANKSFFFSSLVGKRVVVFADENNRRLLMTNWFKRLTGDDAVIINPKNEKAFSCRLNVKSIVFSNYEPEFDNTKAHLRRIIYCCSKRARHYEVDPKFYDKLHKEIPHILFKCKQQYEKLAPEHGPIVTDHDLAYEIGAQKDFEKEEFFDEFFELDDNGFIERSALQKEVNKQLKIKFLNFNYSDFRHYLQATHGIFNRKRLVNNKRISGYSGIVFKDRG